MSLLSRTLLALFVVSSMASDTKCDGAETCQASVANIIEEDTELDDNALLQTERKKVVQHSKPTEPPPPPDTELVELPSDPSDQDRSIRASLPAEKQANFDYLRSLLKAVKLGHVDSINTDALSLLASGSTPSHVGMEVSHAKAHLEKFDISKDGKLDKQELDAMLNHTIDRGDDDAELAEIGSGSGQWEDFSTGSGAFGRRYDKPRYFKPRVMYPGTDYTFEGCFLQCFVFTNNCYKYMYTNAKTDGSNGGMCRGFPNNNEDVVNGQPQWKGWYLSNTGNYIYCAWCTR